ncbi:MAG: amidohydrolase family protein [Xanthobacteraceae bacterium]
MIVDVHGHLVPPELLEAIRKFRARFASVRLVEDGPTLALAFAGGKPSRPIMPGLSDVTGRISWMDREGIDRQVNGSWPDWFGYELPPQEGEVWCRLINEIQLAAAAAEPRFVPLAVVPLQDGARAAAVLRAAMTAGFSGVMISTLPRGIGSVLDARDLDAFWAAADDTGAFIHIHPSYDAGDVRVNDYGLANGVGRISDAIVAVARLLCSGHVTRYHSARIFAPMGAAGLPFLLGRLSRNAEITRGVANPLDGLSLIYTDTIVHDARVLRFVIEMIGADRMMMGSDMPFPIGDEHPAKIIQAARLSADQIASISGGLAEQLFRLA